MQRTIQDLEPTFALQLHTAVPRGIGASPGLLPATQDVPEVVRADVVLHERVDHEVTGLPVDGARLVHRLQPPRRASVTLHPVFLDFESKALETLITFENL